MAHEQDGVEKLWRDYGAVFRGFDDLTLARWMAQTLGQLQGGLWRLSHPLLASYRLAAQVAHERQIWHQRLINVPPDYLTAECCRAPLLPMITRDLPESGLVCLHCNGTAVALDEIGKHRKTLEQWALKYAPVHTVAHWDDKQRKAARDYDKAYDAAAEEAEQLLMELGSKLARPLLDSYCTVVWEDHDECLQVRPEDILV